MNIKANQLLCFGGQSFFWCRIALKRQPHKRILDSSQFLTVEWVAYSAKKEYRLLIIDTGLEMEDASSLSKVQLAALPIRSRSYGNTQPTFGRQGFIQPSRMQERGEGGEFAYMSSNLRSLIARACILNIN